MDLRRLLLWRSSGLVGVGTCLVLLGCSRSVPPKATPKPASNELARVGAEVITVEQFQAVAARRGAGDSPAARKALLDEMVRFRAAVQEAKKRGLDHDPELVAAWESMLAGKVREIERDKAQAKLEVTPSEIESEYRAKPEKFTTPERVRAAMIFVEAPGGFNAESRAERRHLIEEARVKALALGTDAVGFGPLAAEISFDQGTKYRGGDLGYLVAGTDFDGMEKPVLDTAFALKTPGDISEVVETPKGFYLVRLLEKQPGGVRPLDSVAPAISNRLRHERSREIERQISSSLLTDQHVVIHEDRLSTVILPAANREHTTDNPPPTPANVQER